MVDVAPAVEICNLVKEFKTSFRRHPLRAVDDVSIRIMPGEV
jgi:ABC-type glutathione transport system ATPase component